MFRYFERLEPKTIAKYYGFRRMRSPEKVCHFVDKATITYSEWYRNVKTMRLSMRRNLATPHAREHSSADSVSWTFGLKLWATITGGISIKRFEQSIRTIRFRSGKRPMSLGVLVLPNLSVPTVLLQFTQRYPVVRDRGYPTSFIRPVLPSRSLGLTLRVH